MDLVEMINKKLPKEIAITQVRRSDDKSKVYYITYRAHYMAWCMYALLFPGQTHERLEQRGGFAEGELDAFYPEWRQHIVK